MFDISGQSHGVQTADLELGLKFFQHFDEIVSQIEAGA